MIVYGWGYFNRRDHSLVCSGCPKCGAYGYKHSYTSTRYVTLYWIPVVPTGRQKVISDCPQCGQALGMSYGKWKKLKNTELPKAVAAYERDPTNEEAAETVLGAVYNAQDESTLRKVGPEIRAAFAQNEKMMSLLAHSYSHLCMRTEAEEAYLHAMSLTDDEELTEDANAYIELQSQTKPSPPNRLLQSLPVLIVPAIILFFFMSYLGNITARGPSTAYLINGTDYDYQITLNGEVEALDAHSKIRTDNVLYGLNEITGTINGIPIKPIQYDLQVDRSERGSGGPLVIVNPDKSSVVITESTPYSERELTSNTYTYQFHTGKAFHVHDDIDYVFRDYPETVSIPSSSSIVYKTRISAFEEESTAEIASILLQNEKNNELKRFIKAKVDIGADDAMTIAYAQAFLDADYFEQITQTRIAERPVKIEWHRAYQTALKRTQSDAETEALYKTLSAAEPNNSALTYLYGRVVSDHGESVDVFERAVAQENPTGYAANALAYNYMLEGKYPLALDYIDKAVATNPDNPQFAGMRTKILYGLGSFATISKELDEDLTYPFQDYNAVMSKVYCLGRMRDPAAANALIQQFLSQIENNGEDPSYSRYDLQLTLAIAREDVGAVVSMTVDNTDDAWVFRTPMLTGQIEKASNAINGNADYAGILDHLTLFVLAQKKGEGAIAKSHLDTAIETLSAGSNDEKAWAQWLKGGVVPNLEDAIHTCVDLDYHFVYLAALAGVHSAEGPQFASHARSITPQPDFYTLALEPVL